MTALPPRPLRRGEPAPCSVTEPHGDHLVIVAGHPHLCPGVPAVERGTAPRTRRVAEHHHGDPPGVGRHHVEVAGHQFERRSWWRRWECRRCLVPRALHPTTVWVKARPL